MGKHQEIPCSCTYAIDKDLSTGAATETDDRAGWIVDKTRV